MNRIERVVMQMREQGFAKLIVSDPETIAYLTEYSFSPGNRMLVLLLDAEGAHRLLINELFPVKDYPYPVEFFKDTDDPVALLNERLSDELVGIDKNWPSRFLISLLEKRPSLQMKNGSYIIDEIRQQKDEGEKQLMRRASALNDLLMERTIAIIEPGMTELDVKAEMENIIAEIGSDAFSFSPIVASGVNGADPHHGTDDSVIGQGAIVLDMGIKKDGYCADMTRTVYVGEPDEEFLKVYGIVREANERAIRLIRPGVTFREVDAAARDYITEHGYGPNFTHRLGHSIGREVHEFGDVSATNDAPLKPGMCFSIEPGIYLEGKFGVRIEDLVCVTEDGVEVLNHVTKELRRIG